MQDTENVVVALAAGGVLAVVCRVCEVCGAE
jgi:hypothetical protein